MSGSYGFVYFDIVCHSLISGQCEFCEQPPPTRDGAAVWPPEKEAKLISGQCWSFDCGAGDKRS